MHVERRLSLFIPGIYNALHTYFYIEPYIDVYVDVLCCLAGGPGSSQEHRPRPRVRLPFAPRRRPSGARGCAEGRPGLGLRFTGAAARRAVGVDRRAQQQRRDPPAAR